MIFEDNIEDDFTQDNDDFEDIINDDFIKNNDDF